jgi:hypothetical protein
VTQTARIAEPYLVELAQVGATRIRQPRTTFVSTEPRRGRGDAPASADIPRAIELRRVPFPDAFFIVDIPSSQRPLLYGVKYRRARSRATTQAPSSPRHRTALAAQWNAQFKNEATTLPSQQYGDENTASTLPSQ